MGLKYGSRLHNLSPFAAILKDKNLGYFQLDLKIEHVDWLTFNKVTFQWGGSFGKPFQTSLGIRLQKKPMLTVILGIIRKY